MTACESAWGSDAERHAKSLRSLIWVGSFPSRRFTCRRTIRKRRADYVALCCKELRADGGGIHLYVSCGNFSPALGAQYWAWLNK
jgi:hypothetical protein